MPHRSATIESAVILRHRRFVIRKYTIHDASDLMNYFGHPAVIKGVRGKTWKYRLTDAKKFIREKIRQDQRQGKRPAHVIDIHGRLAGGVGVNIDGRSGEIGYWLAKPNWGQGIMTAVVRAWTAYVMKKYRLKQVTAKIFPFNQASARVLQKNGFQFEARIVLKKKSNKQIQDEMIFSKTKKQ